MEIRPELQNALDKELAYLKSFNNSYLDESLDFYLQDTELQIKPIIEAIALFSARTQLSGKQQIDLLHQRLIKQLMAYLVTPIPAMGLVKIKVDDLIEPVSIPAGTVLLVSTYDDQEAQFKTLYDTHLQAICLSNTGIANKPGEYSKLVLQLDALNDYPGKIDKLRLCLYGQGYYPNSINLKELLKTHCLKTELRFNNGTNIPCSIDFSKPQNAAQGDTIHPVTQERQFFQLPHKHSFITLQTEQEPPKTWKSCQVVFSFNCMWPDHLLVDNELIQLFAIPVENRVSAQADPFFYNGTQNQHRIIAPSIMPKMQICSVRGIYQIKDGEHIPLSSNVLVDDDNTYEISYPHEGLDNGRQYPLLLLNMPEAFDTPVKIMTDAYWHDPEFSKATNKSLRVHPADFEITGVQWNFLNINGKKFTPFHPPTALTSTQLLELAALKNKPMLTLEEVLFITHALSTVWKAEFKELKNYIEYLDVAHEYRAERFNPAKTAEKPLLRYTLTFADFDPQLNPLAEELLKHMEQILQYWISHHEIRLVGHYANMIAKKPDRSIHTEAAKEPDYAY
jgi:type VI secretion system protein ImpG